MNVIENRQTGKRHLPGDGDALTLCGANLVVDCRENARFIDDSWLDQFPEDFGDAHFDCRTCARAADLGGE